MRQKAFVELFQGRWYIVPYAYSVEDFMTNGDEWFILDNTASYQAQGETILEALARFSKRLPYSVYSKGPPEKNVYTVMFGGKKATHKLLEQVWSVYIYRDDDRIRIVLTKRIKPYSRAHVGEEKWVILPTSVSPEELARGVEEGLRHCEPPSTEEAWLGPAKSP
ncbi:MAG: contact-dependent growth inhibition system immunity protein [Gemmatales bacterium]|nr:contact-dependent growth inhibition system immunity protein [Gemmatales bacterium]MDW7995744.1 contact-dependent growth inhibition system immunity protein [Gemmatales bacterium]